MSFSVMLMSSKVELLSVNSDILMMITDSKAFYCKFLHQVLLYLIFTHWNILSLIVEGLTKIWTNSF